MDATITMRRITWEDYESFNIYRHTTIGDGSCLIHSVCSSIYVPYRTERLNGVKVSKKYIVKQFKKELSDKLTEIDPLTGDMYYYSIGTFSEHFSNEFLLENLRKLLNSDEYLGEETILMIEYILNIDIYILDGKTRDIHMRDTIPDGRNGIVVIYENQHYEPVTVKETYDGSHTSYYKSNHPFLSFLRERMRSRKETK